MKDFLETNRLVLRFPDVSDFNHLLALRSDPDVMKYIGKNGEIQTKEQVECFLSAAIAYQHKHGFGFCSVFEKETGAFVGQAGLFHVDFCEEQAEIEIAYRLHKKFWGKGYATELAKALIHWGFTHLSVTKLIALAHPENKASRRVLEKSGMDFREKKTYYGLEVCCYDTYRNDGIELVPYDAQWPLMAEFEIRKLRDIFPKEQLIDIQHIGSTAIPGMSAKPIVDIQVAVNSLVDAKNFAIGALESLGYVYWADNPDTERMFFVKGMPPFGEKRTHHVHIVEPKSKHWLGKIAFRDYLVAHPAAMREYEDLKKNLASPHTFDREKYTEAKTAFVTKILRKAGIAWK